MPRKTALPSSKPSKAAKQAAPALKETNGSLAPTAAAEPIHQTHGGYTPTSGPIRSVRDLALRTGAMRRTAVGAFPTLQAYAKHIRGLNKAELDRHAIEEAHIVPIDDKEGLYRRLENEWSEHNLREPDSTVAAALPKREPFTAEQLAKQEAIRTKLLGPLANRR